MQIDNEDNGWYVRGELPPIGVYCEYQGGQGTWHKGTIAAHVSESGILVAIIQGANCWTYSSVPGRFRPIKSERERVIEAVIDSLDGFADIPCMVTHNRIFLETLYRAGFLKLPDGDKS